MCDQKTKKKQKKYKTIFIYKYKLFYLIIYYITGRPWSKKKTHTQNGKETNGKKSQFAHIMSSVVKTATILICICFIWIWARAQVQSALTWRTRKRTDLTQNKSEFWGVFFSCSLCLLNYKYVSMPFNINHRMNWLRSFNWVWPRDPICIAVRSKDNRRWKIKEKYIETTNESSETVSEQHIRLYCLDIGVNCMLPCFRLVCQCILIKLSKNKTRQFY